MDSSVRLSELLLDPIPSSATKSDLFLFFLAFRVVTSSRYGSRLCLDVSSNDEDVRDGRDYTEHCTDI